jgi:hypothetical protein
VVELRYREIYYRRDDDLAERWDRVRVRLFEDTYGDYLLDKVGKVSEVLQNVL